MNEERKKINLKILIPVLLTTILVLAGLWFWSQYGIIEISGPDASVDIVSSGGKTTSLQLNDNKINKMVRKGNYSIYLSKDNSSYLSTTSVGGFLKKSSVKATLTKERERIFVGDNPLPCMVYVNQLLRSYECLGATDSLITHRPGVGNQATYTQVEKITQGDVSGAMDINGSLMVIARPVYVDSEPAYFAYALVGNDTYQEFRLAGVDGTKDYVAKPYKNGFLLFSEDFDSILFFASPQEKPSEISLPKPKDSNLKPVGLEVNGSRIVVLYTNNQDGSVADVHDVGGKRKIKNSLIYYVNDQAQLIDINGTQITKAMPCGKAMLCLWSDGNIRTYELKDGDLRLSSDIYGPSEVSASGENLYINLANKTILFRPDAKTGYSIYGAGEYSLCGTQTWERGQILCVITPRSTRSALLIDESREVSDEIDKKILSLASSAAVFSYSIYGNSIVIAPESGATIYSSSLGSYIYDPVYVKKQVASINQTLSGTGINTSNYSVNIIGN